MYVAGWNLAGCVSDPDSNHYTYHWDDAVAYIKEIIEAWWDADYHIVSWDVNQELTAEVKEEIDNRYIHAHTLLHNDPPPPDFFAITKDYSGNDWEVWIVEVEGEMDEY